MMALYQTVPNLPDQTGAITGATGYRKATVTMTHAHALQIGELLVKQGTRGGKK
ncbi:MAG: hypothetical protein IIB36_11365 [Gemmatimonadetes bacterium]|nr:hypothetical protein [Gemmatimonadota bacterium]